MISSNFLYIKGFLSKNHKLYGKNRAFAASFHGSRSRHYRTQQRSDRHLAGQQILHEAGSGFVVGEIMTPSLRLLENGLHFIWSGLGSVQRFRQRSRVQASSGKANDVVQAFGFGFRLFVQARFRPEHGKVFSGLFLGMSAAFIRKLSS